MQIYFFSFFSFCDFHDYDNYIHIHSIIHRTIYCFCWSADAERPICPSCPVPNLPRSLHDGKPTSRNVNFKLERYASCSHRPGQASTHITIKHPELTVIYLACLDVWSLLLNLFYVLQHKTIDCAFAKYWFCFTSLRSHFMCEVCWAIKSPRQHMQTIYWLNWVREGKRAANPHQSRSQPRN